MLGKLALHKQAQYAGVPGASAASVIQPWQRRMVENQQSLQRHSQYPSFFEPGPTQQQVSGFTTPMQQVTEGLVGTIGPIGILASQLGAGKIQELLQGLGFDPNQPLQTTYGGNVDAFKKAQQIQSTLIANQMQHQGTRTQDIAQKLGAWVKSRTGMDITGFTNAVAGMNPTSVAMFVQQLTMNFPELQGIMSMVDPKMIVDFSPAVKAAYRAGGGKFSEKAFKNVLSQFQSAYNAGKFGDMPAQIALSSVGYASEHLGKNATIKDAANFARAAHELVQRGVAPTFGAAMHLAGTVDDPVKIAKDPSRVMQYAAYIDDQASKGFVSKEHLANASKYAEQYGLSIPAAMTAVTVGGRVRHELGGKRGRDYADAVAKAMSNASKSTDMQTLAVLHESNPRLRKYIDNAMRSGDMHRLKRLATKYQSDADVMMERGSVDAADFVTRLSAANPNMVKAMYMQDVQDYVKNTGNRELGALLKNKDELARRLREKDFTGLSRKTRQALRLGGPTEGRLAGVLAMDADLAKPGRYLRSPVRKPSESPTRLGIQYPAKKGPAALELPDTTKT